LTTPPKKTRRKQFSSSTPPPRISIGASSSASGSGNNSSGGTRIPVLRYSPTTKTAITQIFNKLKVIQKKAQEIIALSEQPDKPPGVLRAAVAVVVAFGGNVGGPMRPSMCMLTAHNDAIAGATADLRKSSKAGSGIETESLERPSRQDRLWLR